MQEKTVEVLGKQFHVGDILVLDDAVSRVTDNGVELVPRPKFKSKCMSDGTVYEILPSGSYRKLKGEEVRVWHAYNKIDQNVAKKLHGVGL